MKVAARLAAIVVVAVFCVWALEHWVRKPYRCNAEIGALDASTTLAETAPSSHDANVRARQNLDALLALRDSCGNGPLIYMLIAANQRLLGQHEQALATYRDALRVDQRPEIYVALGDVLLSLNRFNEAVDAYATAVAFNPAVIERIPSAEVAQEVRRKLKL